MRIPRYIGESSRSAFERGHEHLEKLANLNSNSHMLRHMLDKHEGVDFKDVQWGMFIVEYKRSAFERQIQEAVTIEKESKKCEILNSKAEWNQYALPRLVTRMGDRETEVRGLEEELRKEKKIEDEIEAKVRALRKERNKARLLTDNNKPNKRQKIDTENYISVREVWGPPTSTAPKKKKIETEKIERNKKIRIGEKLENLVRIEDKVYEGETLEEGQFEIQTVDWDKVLKEHKERLEEERNKREAQLEKRAVKERSWQLFRECKIFLEENDKNWQARKIEEELDRKRKERLAEGKEKQERIQ